MKQVVCMRYYYKDGQRHPCTQDPCPLKTQKFAELLKIPSCLLSLVVPTAYLTEAKGDQAKAARKYVETWPLSE